MAFDPSQFKSPSQVQNSGEISGPEEKTSTRFDPSRFKSPTQSNTLPEGQNAVQGNIDPSTGKAVPTPEEQANLDQIKADLAQRPQATALGRIGSGIEGLAEGGRRFAEGITQTGAILGEGIGILPEDAAQTYTDTVAANQRQRKEDIIARYGEEYRPNVSGATGVGELATGLLGGGLLGKAFRGAVAGSGKVAGFLGNRMGDFMAGYTFFNPNIEDKTSQGLLATSIGAVGSAISKVPQLAQPLKRASQKVKSTAKISNVLTPGEKLKTARMKTMAENRGYDLLVSEASGSKVAKAREARIPLTSKGQEKAAQWSVGREQKLLRESKQAISRGLAPEGRKELGQLVEQNYKRLESVNVPKAVQKSLRENPLVAKAEKALQNPEAAAAVKLTQVPKDSVAYWDKVLRQVDVDSGKFLTKSGKVAPGYMDTIKNMKGTLGKVDPAYITTRKLAQREIIANRVAEELPIINSTKDLQTFVNKTEGLVKTLGHHGEATQAAFDYLKLLKGVQNSSLPSLTGRAPVDEMTKFVIQSGGGVGSRATAWMQQKLSGRLGDVTLQALTNPKYQESLSKIAKIVNEKTRTERFLQFLTDVYKRDVAQNVRKDEQ